MFSIHSISILSIILASLSSKVIAGTNDSKKIAEIESSIKNDNLTKSIEIINPIWLQCKKTIEDHCIDVAYLTIDIHYKRRRFEKAYAETENAKKLFPDDLLLNYYQLKNAIINPIWPGQYLHVFERFISTNKKDSSSLEKAATLMREYNFFGKALRIYLLLIKNKQKNISFKWLGSECAILSEKIEIANMILGSIPDKYIGKKQIYYAMIDFSKKEYHKAKERLEKIKTKKSRNNFQLEYLLSEINTNLGHFQTALEHLNNAFKRHKNHPDYIIALSRIAYNNYGIGESQRIIKTIDERSPTPSAKAMKEHATYLLSSNILELSRQLLERVLKQNTKDFSSLVSLGWVYHRSRNYPKALSLFKKAYALNQESPIIHENIALIYGYLGLYEEAISHIKKAESLVLRPRVYSKLYRAAIYALQGINEKKVKILLRYVFEHKGSEINVTEDILDEPAFSSYTAYYSSINE